MPPTARRSTTSGRWASPSSSRSSRRRTSRRSPRPPAVAASPRAPRRISNRFASGSKTATARSCWTPKSTPTSVPNGWRRHFVATDTLTNLAAALSSGDIRVVDLTQPLSETTPVLQLPPPFANTPGLSRETISEYDDKGPAWAWATLTVGEHVGTHFDAPIHWITGRDGEDVASASPAKLVAPVAVIAQSAESAADPNYLFTLADLRAWEIEHGSLPAGGWLFLRTGWDARSHDQEAFLNGAETPGPDA